MTVLAHAVPAPEGRPDLAPLYVDDVGAPARRSYASYFNAFPAGYWSKWTVVKDVTVSVRTRGTGTVQLFRTDRSSQSQVVLSNDVDGEATTTYVYSLQGLSRGGWFWFDLVGEELELVEATWTTESVPRTERPASIGITTFNKPDYCVATLQALAAAPEALSVLDRIYLVDQGTSKVADADGFEEVAAALGDTLELIEQPNLGGSGGFSRSMLETLDADRAAFTLLLDDDVEVEPEAIYKLVQFGRFTRRPTITGGHMFDMLNPTVLHAWAEVMDFNWFVWRPGPPVHIRHDLADRNLRATTWMHRRDDADYTGWWMCLIPTEAMNRVGLSLPAFIKWDDAEYSIRAKNAGVPTVSLPGSALWHIAWVDKDDSREWQAYFHARNRIVAALLHSPRAGGGNLLTNLGRVDVKHMLCTEYYAAALRERAYRDILLGPDHLHGEIATINASLRKDRLEFVENVEYKTPQEIPDSVQGRLTFDIEVDLPPSARRLPVWTAQQIARHWCVPSPAPDSTPEVELARRDATWWRMARYDSVVVTDSSRMTAVVYRRDRDHFRDQFRRSREALKTLHKNWDALATQYRKALPDFVSPQEWRKTFKP